MNWGIFYRFNSLSNGLNSSKTHIRFHGRIMVPLSLLNTDNILHNLSNRKKNDKFSDKLKIINSSIMKISSILMNWYGL